MLARSLPFASSAVALLACVLPHSRAAAADFETEVRPLLQKYCYECHGADKQKSGVNYEAYPSADDLIADTEVMEITQFVLDEREMPPKTADHHPTDAEISLISDWVHHELVALENASPNDPGLVVMPRLNHREYERVIRELTGLPFDAGGFLPQDSSAGEGFLNVGQAQQMDIGQFEAFLGAAKAVLNHAVPSPTEGLVWSRTPFATQPTPSKTIDEMKRYHADAIDQLLLPIYTRHVDWLRKNGVHGVYLEACWRYKYRKELGLGDSFEAVAQSFEEPLLPSSIQRWWNLLHWEQFKPAGYQPKVWEPAEDWLADPDISGGVYGWVDRKHILQMAIEKWHEVGPPQGRALDQKREENRAVAAFIRQFQRPAKNCSIRGPKRRDVNMFMGGFEGTEYWSIDLSKVKGDFIYLMITDCLDGNEGDYVVWEAGDLVVGKGKNERKIPWQEVFPQVTDRDGQPVAWGSHPLNDPLPAGSIGVQAPSVLRLELPKDPKLRKAVLHCQVSLDPKRGMNASTQNMIDDEIHDLPWLANRVLGKLKSAAAHRAEFGAGFGDMLDTQYRPLGQPTDEELDWIPNLNKDAAQFAFLSEPEARALGFEWPLNFKHEFYFTWPLQFNAPADFLPLMTAEEKEEFHRINRTFASLGMAEYLALEQARRAYGIPAAEGEIFPTDAELAGLTPPQRQEIERLSAALEARIASDREQAKQHLSEFIRVAWRGRGTESDVERFLSLYDKERHTGAHYVNAVRSAMLPMLIHPKFLFRISPAQESQEIAPIDEISLASRLSFMLWGGLPDQELLDLAEAGELSKPDVLRAQVARMMKDERSIALATEFAGFWLGFADLREAMAPDPDRFKDFTPELREAAYREVLEFFDHLFREDAPVTDALFADYTFLNEPLAEHYGIKGVKGKALRKVRVDNGQRGGILGMAGFLTKYGQPLRTSPVKRGAWIYETVLGIHMPPPPPVPAISADERDEQGRSMREQLEQHRDDPACFSCHDRIDPLGIALENFDAVGAWRTADRSGAPIDSDGRFVSNGRVLEGLAGLEEFLREQEEQFLENFCVKLVGYGLGRAVQVTDRPLIEEMLDRLEQNENRPSVAIDALVTSPQFLYQRQFPQGETADSLSQF